MKVPVEGVEDLLRKAAEKIVTSPEAEYFAHLCIQSHLRRFPRLNPLEEAISDLQVWNRASAALKPPELRIDAEKAGTFIVDFSGLPPSVKLKYVHDELFTRAGRNGIAAAGLRNSSGIITLLPWALGLGQRDCIGLAMYNGGVNGCVPFGGTVGLFGTLPFAYSIPTDGVPVTADMATTEIPFFQIKKAKETGEPLPVNSAVDGRGQPTTDASEALSDSGIANLLPMGGGFKGYSLMVLIEVLTGSLVRSLLSNRQTAGWHPEEHGAFIIAIDIASFTDLGRFKTEVSELCRVIRNQEPGEGHDEVPVPGDRGSRRAEATRASGEVEVPENLMRDLELLASG